MMIRLLLAAIVLLPAMTGLAEIQPFRFAQLTDVHLKAGDPLPEQWLMRSIRQINATDSIDFVLVTGDLADDGDRESIMRVKACLDSLRPRYYVIPGNHETTWSDSGLMAYVTTFGGERIEFEHNGILFLGFNTGPLMRMAYGHVVPQDIAWLRAEMDKRGKAQPVILVTHYPILKGDVDNWYEVTDAVRPYNVRLFIGGHYHANRCLSYDGIPGVLMRSNLRDADGNNGYGIYEVDNDSIRVFTQITGGKKYEWASFPMQGDLYDHAGKANEYPDFSVNDRYKVAVKWQHRSEAGIYAAAASDGRRVFVGDGAGRLTAYDIRSGRRMWQFAAGHRIYGEPDVKSGVVVFGAADSTVYGLSAKNGAKLWAVKAGGPVTGGVRISGGVAYVGGTDHCMRAIDLRSGRLLWSHGGVKGYVVTRPLVADGKVIFGAWDGSLYALSARDGSELWQWHNPRKGLHFSPASVWPVFSRGKVFIVDPVRELTAIDASTGQTVYSTRASRVRESLGLSSDGTRLFAKTMNDSLVCYSALSDHPEEIWASAIGYGYDHAPSQDLESRGTVYGSTSSGLIFAVSAADGSILWQHKIGESLVNTVMPVKGGVVATSTDGTVILISDKR